MREWLPEDDLVFVVLDAVATLDLGEFPPPRQARQYQAAEAKTFAGTVNATWGWRQPPRPPPRSGSVGSGQQRYVATRCVTGSVDENTRSRRSVRGRQAAARAP